MKFTLGKKASYFGCLPPTPPQIASIHKTENRIAIDGILENDYLDNESKYINNIAYGNVNGANAGELISATENNDSYSQWYSTWDVQNYYLFVQITDNELISIDSEMNYENTDGIEINIDANNERQINNERLLGEQHQLHINLALNKNSKNAVLTGLFFVDEEDNDATNINYQITVEPKGYNVELAIPWATFYKTYWNTRAEALVLAQESENFITGKKIALELSLIDADEQNLRKSVLNWSNPTGNNISSEKTEYYGEISLLNYPVSIKQNISNIQVYPNPAKQTIIIESFNGIKYVEVYENILLECLTN